MQTMQNFESTSFCCGLGPPTYCQADPRPFPDFLPQVSFPTNEGRQVCSLPTTMKQMPTSLTKSPVVSQKQGLKYQIHVNVVAHVPSDDARFQSFSMV